MTPEEEIAKCFAKLRETKVYKNEKGNFLSVLDYLEKLLAIHHKHLKEMTTIVEQQVRFLKSENEALRLHMRIVGAEEQKERIH